MCRLLGIVSSECTCFRLALHEAPRSLAHLSREHRHGWGVGVWSDAAGWALQKRPGCAHEDAQFHAVAAGSRGEVLLAHVRLRTVGPETYENTHPFRRGRWLFAHNGTIKDQGFLREHASAARLAELEGETDSELFFAYLLSRLDAAGLTGFPATPLTDLVLASAMDAALARPEFGACNFLLTDGRTLWAHRHGRTLFLLEKDPGDAVRTTRASTTTGITIETPWSPRRHAVFVASEALTDEPWLPLPEGTLLRIDRLPETRWVDARSGAKALG